MKARKSIGKKIKIFLVLILLVAIVGLAVFWFYIKPKSKTPPDNSYAIVQMQEKITELSENVENMVIVLSDKEATIQVMSVDLADAYNELDSTKRAMDTLCDEIDAKNLTIAQLEKDKEEQQAKFDELSQDVEANKTEIEKVKVKLEEITTALTNAQSDLQNMQTRLSEIETKVSTLEIKVAKNEVEIEEIKQDISTIKTNISNLQKQITDLQTSIDELKASAVQIVESGTGYIKYNDGNVIQYGGIYIQKGGTVLNFTVNFIDTGYGISVTPFYVDTGSKLISAKLVTFTNSSVKIILSHQYGTDTQFVEGPVSYVAIGKWK